METILGYDFELEQTSYGYKITSKSQCCVKQGFNHVNENHSCIFINEEKLPNNRVSASAHCYTHGLKRLNQGVALQIYDVLFPNQ